MNPFKAAYSSFPWLLFDSFCYSYPSSYRLSPNSSYSSPTRCWCERRQNRQSSKARPGGCWRWFCASDRHWSSSSAQRVRDPAEGNPWGGGSPVLNPCQRWCGFLCPAVPGTLLFVREEAPLQPVKAGQVTPFISEPFFVLSHMPDRKSLMLKQVICLAEHHPCPGL